MTSSGPLLILTTSRRKWDAHTFPPKASVHSWTPRRKDPERNTADQEKHWSLKLFPPCFRIHKLVTCPNAKVFKHIGSDPEKKLEANLDLQKSKISVGLKMFKQTLNPLTSKVNISNTTNSTSSPSLLSIISSSSPDLVLLCGDGSSPLLLHSAVAQSHFPVIFNVFQVILNINVLSLFLITLLSYHHDHHHHTGVDGVKRAKPVLERERSGGDQPALIIIAIIIVIIPRFLSAFISEL